MAASSARIVTCPKCKAKHDASKVSPGKPITCQRCKAPFAVPSAAAATAVDGGRAATVKMPAAKPANRATSATAVGGKTTERIPVMTAKRAAPAAAPAPAAPVPRRERMTPLMRAVHTSDGGVPQKEPRASYAERGGRRSKDNTGLIIGGVIGGLVLIVAVIILMNNSNKPAKGGTSSAGGVANYGSSTAPSSSETSSASSSIPEPAVATSTGSGDSASTPAGDPPPRRPKETPPATEPPPGPDSGDGGEEPPEEPRPEPKWEMDPDVKAKVDGYIQELFDGARESKDVNKDIRALGRAALPPIIETLIDPDPIKARMASGLLAMLIERNPVSDPSATVEDRRKFYEQEKKWYLRHYYDIQIAEGERSKKSDEDIKAEVKEIVKEIAVGGITDRQRCVKLLQNFGKNVVPILIDFLDESDKDFADASAVALQDLTHHTDFGPLPRSGSVAGYIEKWRKWWAENKEKVTIP